VSLPNLKSLAPGTNLEAVFLHSDGSQSVIPLTHSLTAEQIRWFHAGSALNLLSKLEA
jgi:aconitate hydratase